MAWPILMILVSFCRILNGLLDEINLFWRCSSPLNKDELTTVFPRFSAPGRLPIFEVFGGALNRAGALIKTYENLDLPFPAHTRTLFMIYDP